MGNEENKTKMTSFTMVFDGNVESAKEETQKIEKNLTTLWDKQKMESLYGYYDEDGKEIVPRQYQEVRELKEGMIAVRSHTRWGFYNVYGELAIPFDYTDADSFCEGLACVRQKGKYGFIDKSGNVVIPFKYDSARCFSEAMALVSIKDKYGYINKNGEVMIPIEKTRFSSDFHEDLAWGWGPNGGVGYFDKSGKVVIPYEYRFGSDFQNELAAVKKGKLWGLINKQNEVIVPFEYQLIGHLVCGRRLVKKDDKYGFVDSQGKLVIDVKFDYAESFDSYDETSLVEIGDKCCSIDIDGKLLEEDY